MSECLTHFIRQNNAQVATGSLYSANSHCPGYDLRSLPRNSAYRFHKDFPRVTDDCLIVSMVGPIVAFLGFIMRTNGILTGKFVLLGLGCALMLAFSHNASAAPQIMPPSIVSVPDGGTTALLLGAALGALGLARRFLWR